MKLERYLIYGITIDSELPFLHWPKANDSVDTTCDVKIQFGEIDSLWNDRAPEGTWLLVSPSDVFVRIDSVGKFLISGGNSVTFQPCGANSIDAWLYVEGVITGAILHQRHVWPLHASAVVNPSGSVTAFIGQRGAGKSTLLFELQKREHPLVADDIAAITFDDNGFAVVAPGFPQGKLCIDAAERFGLRVSELKPIANTERHKVAVPYTNSFCQTPRILSEIFLLGNSDEQTVRCTELKGIEKLRQLSDNTYRLELLAGDEDLQRLFSNISAASKHLKAFQLTRPSEGDSVRALADLIEQRWNQSA